MSISKLFTFSFNKEKVPASWKFAEVHLIPRHNDPSYPDNYKTSLVAVSFGKAMQLLLC
jgi:hypothetical protein